MIAPTSYPESNELTTQPLTGGHYASLMSAALAYARRGMPVFPCKPDKSPHYQRNTLERGHIDATTAPEQIRRWWTRWPNANIGLVTGERSGILVLDIDPDKGGDASLAALEAEIGALPRTATVRTGGGGRHLYFRYPTGSGIRNSAGALGLGLDVRGEGGYVAAPPSRTTSLYETLDDAPLADPPDWLTEALTEPLRAAGKAPAGPPRSAPVALGETIPEGGRNAGLTRIAGRLRARGFDGPELLAKLERINADQCSPPLPALEVRKIARSAERWPVGSARPAPGPEVLEALERIARDLLNYRAWPGVGGKSERSIVAALVVLARKHGQLCPAGVRVEVSFRDLALLAAVPSRTVTRAISRLKLKRGVLRADNFGRRPEESGALVLLHPGASDHTPATSSAPEGANVVGGVVTLTTPRLRNSAPGILRLGKTSEALIDHLTASRTGTGEVSTLAALMGSDKPGSVRYLKRHVLPRLAEADVVTLDGDTVALTGDWRGALDRERERAGEIERYRLDVARYDRERLRHTVKLLWSRGRTEEQIAERVGISPERVREILKRPEPVPEPPKREEREASPETRPAPVASPKETAAKFELSIDNTLEREKAPEPLAGRTGPEPRREDGEELDLLDIGIDSDPEPAGLSALAVAVRDYLARNPHDAHQPPGWIGSTLWCHDLYPGKPTPAEIRAARDELAGERAA